MGTNPLNNNKSFSVFFNFKKKWNFLISSRFRTGWTWKKFRLPLPRLEAQSFTRIGCPSFRIDSRFYYTSVGRVICKRVAFKHSLNNQLGNRPQSSASRKTTSWELPSRQQLYQKFPARTHDDVRLKQSRKLSRQTDRQDPTHGPSLVCLGILYCATNVVSISQN